MEYAIRQKFTSRSFWKMGLDIGAIERDGR